MAFVNMFANYFKSDLQKLSNIKPFRLVSAQGMFFSDDKKQEKTVNLCHIRDKNDKDHNNTNTMTS